jgi:subtilisin family serine protease
LAEEKTQKGSVVVNIYSLWLRSVSLLKINRAPLLIVCALGLTIATSGCTTEERSNPVDSTRFTKGPAHEASKKLIVTLKAEPSNSGETKKISLQKFTRKLSKNLKVQPSEVTEYKNIGVLAIHKYDDETRTRLEQMPEVASVEENRIFWADNLPAFPPTGGYAAFEGRNVGLDIYQTSLLREIKCRGSATDCARDVRVGILDSGARPTHEALKDFIIEPAMILDDRSSIKFDSAIKDLNGHGTHVASCLLAGVATAEKAGLPPDIARRIRVLPIGIGRTSAPSLELADILAGIDLAISKRVDILNMSFGGPYKSLSTATALRRAEEAGISLFVAAGNETSNLDYTDVSPAGENVASMLGVSALYQMDYATSEPVHAHFTNIGPTSVDILAPGTLILGASNTSDTGYVLHSGTSMAAPIAAGLGALIKAIHPNATPFEIHDLIKAHVFKREPSVQSGAIHFTKTLRAVAGLDPSLADRQPAAESDLTSCPAPALRLFNNEYRCACARVCHILEAPTQTFDSLTPVQRALNYYNALSCPTNCPSLSSGISPQSTSFEAPAGPAQNRKIEIKTVAEVGSSSLTSGAIELWRSPSSAVDTEKISTLIRRQSDFGAYTVNTFATVKLADLGVRPNQSVYLRHLGQTGSGQSFESWRELKVRDGSQMSCPSGSFEQIGTYGLPCSCGFSCWGQRPFEGSTPNQSLHSACPIGCSGDTVIKPKVPPVIDEAQLDAWSIPANGTISGHLSATDGDDDLFQAVIQLWTYSSYNPPSVANGQMSYVKDLATRTLDVESSGLDFSFSFSLSELTGLAPGTYQIRYAVIDRHGFKNPNAQPSWSSWSNWTDTWKYLRVTAAEYQQPTPAPQPPPAPTPEPPAPEPPAPNPTPNPPIAENICPVGSIRYESTYGLNCICGKSCWAYSPFEGGRQYLEYPTEWGACPSACPSSPPPSLTPKP